MVYNQGVKKIFNSAPIYLFAILLISFLIFRSKLNSPGLPIWADNSLPTQNMKSFGEISNFLYSEKNNGLVYNPIFASIYFLINKIFDLFQLMSINNKMLGFLWIFLPYLVVYTSIFLSLSRLLRNKALSFVLTLFYIFGPLNLSWVAAGWSTTSYSHAGSLLFFCFFLIYLKYPKTKYLLIMPILSVIGFMNIAYFYSIAVCCLAYLFVFLAVYDIGLKKAFNNYKSLVILAVFIILINMFWILPVPFMAKGKADAFGLNDIYSTSYLTPLNSFTLLTAIQDSDQFKDVFLFFNSPVYQLCFILLSFAVLYYSIKVFRKDADIRAISIIYLIVFGISLGKNLNIVWSLFKLLPGSQLVRSPQLKFYSLLFFLLSLLIGIIIVRYKSKVLLFLLFVNIVLGVLAFNKGDFFSYSTNLVIPEDYNKVRDYLSLPENRYDTVAMFPPMSHGPMIKWVKNHPYCGFYMDEMLSNPLVVYYWGDARIPSYLKDIYSKEVPDLVGYLGSGGVSFVIVHKDFVQFPVTQDFNNVDNITKVIGGKNIDLYKISDVSYRTLFYSDDGTPVEYERLNPTAYVINTGNKNLINFNSQFNVGWSLYGEGELKKVGYNNCRIYVGSHNICTLLLLFSRNAESHLIGKDNKDSWDLSTSVSNKYLLFYTPQNYLYIGVFISILSLITNVLLLVIYSVKEKTGRDVFINNV